MNKVTQWVLYGIAGVVGAIMLALITFGTLLEWNVLPSPDVQSAKEIPTRHIEALREGGIVDPDETVEMLYLEGFVSVLAGGSILTESRVIAYQTADNELTVWSINYEDVVEVEQTVEGSSSEYSEFVVSTDDDDDWLTLWLPPEDGDDKKFVNALLARTE